MPTSRSRPSRPPASAPARRRAGRARPAAKARRPAPRAEPRPPALRAAAPAPAARAPQRRRARRAAPRREHARQVRLLHHPARRAAALRAASASAPSPPTSTPSTTRTSPRWSPTRRSRSTTPTRENVLAHERVNEAVMRSHTVIPMSFGTVFKTRDDIVELLRARLRRLPRRAQQDAGQARVRPQGAVGPRRRSSARSRSEDEDMRRLQGRDLLPEGLDLLRPHAVRPAGGRRARRAAPSATSARSSSRCATCRVASRANKPIGDKMIMNAAFLVARDQRGGLRRQGQGDRRPVRER